MVLVIIRTRRPATILSIITPRLLLLPRVCQALGHLARALLPPAATRPATATAAATVAVAATIAAGTAATAAAAAGIPATTVAAAGIITSAIIIAAAAAAAAGTTAAATTTAAAATKGRLQLVCAGMRMQCTPIVAKVAALHIILHGGNRRTVVRVIAIAAAAAAAAGAGMRRYMQ